MEIIAFIFCSCVAFIFFLIVLDGIRYSITENVNRVIPIATFAFICALAVFGALKSLERMTHDPKTEGRAKYPPY